MSCPSELTCMMYADAELPAEEARQVEQHLAGCPSCQRVAEALRAENRLLRDLLEETPAEALAAEAAPGPMRLLDLAWTTAAVLGVALLSQAALSWLSDLELPAGLNWLNPFSVTVQWQLFFRSLFYFLQEGAAMLLSSALAIGGLTLVLLFVGGTFYLLRRRPTGVAVLATLSLVFLLAQPGGAVDIRKAPGKALVIAADETVDDTLIFFGETLIVNGTINGNLIAFAERVEINGTVKGDLICFTAKALLNGTVENNAFVFARETSVEGRVGRNLHSFASMTQVAKEGVVEGDALACTSDVSIDGTVNRDLLAFAGSTSIQGTLGRNLRAWTHRLTVLGPARIGGNVEVHVDKQKNVQIDPGATIAGKTQVQLPEPGRSPFATPKFYLQHLLALAIAFLLGQLLYWLHPPLFQARLVNVSDWLKAGGLGFLFVVATPAALLLLGLILVGIGLLAGTFLIATLVPLLGLIFWLLALYLAKVVIAVPIGQALVPSPAGQPTRLAIPMLVGLVIYYVAAYLPHAFNLPWMGLVVRFVLVVLGLGLALTQLWRSRKRPAVA